MPPCWGGGSVFYNRKRAAPNSCTAFLEVSRESFQFAHRVTCPPVVLPWASSSVTSTALLLSSLWFRCSIFAGLVVNPIFSHFRLKLRISCAQPWQDFDLLLPRGKNLELEFTHTESQTATNSQLRAFSVGSLSKTVMSLSKAVSSMK